ncbi:MAG TPA: cytochrome c biogenesis protein CcdA, partial [Gemmatimonadales bacterium]|nr:cytochrome c biogenesis protein CcdA [Gemmatimonadales bacterium]
CIGPILGSILTFAATQGEAAKGATLLGAYSLGLAVPFLAAAWAVDGFIAWFQKFRRFLPWVMRISGVLLIVVGLLLVSGQFTRLASWLQGITPRWLFDLL